MQSKIFNKMTFARYYLKSWAVKNIIENFNNLFWFSFFFSICVCYFFFFFFYLMVNFLTVLIKILCNVNCCRKHAKIFSLHYHFWAEVNLQILKNISHFCQFKSTMDFYFILYIASSKWFFFYMFWVLNKINACLHF